ncbi:MAG: type II toxin-antitoxin system PemK/MazF family toxin [Desulfosalsimonadaceae bacterium]
MKHGEIRWYRFAPPDKKRPVLILTRDSVLEYLGEVTIAPITTMVRNIPSEVFLSKADGMPQDCAVNCDHLQTVSKPKIGPLITSLTSSKMVDVGRRIRFALNI